MVTVMSYQIIINIVVRESYIWLEVVLVSELSNDIPVKKLPLVSAE
jgi:hypothetical protein